MDARKVELILDLLGTNCIEVKRTLEWLGCRGRRCWSGECPVSEYARRQGAQFPSVSTIGLSWGPAFGFTRVTRAVADFILNFDRGEYPELIATGSAERRNGDG